VQLDVVSHDCKTRQKVWFSVCCTLWKEEEEDGEAELVQMA